MPVLKNTCVVGHNRKYDIAVLKRYGVEVPNFDDTLLMSYVLNSGKHHHGLDELSKRYLGHTPLKFKQVTKRTNQEISFADVPLRLATAYAGEDVDVCLKLFDLFSPQLKGAQKKVYLLDRALIPVLVDMEANGICVDQEHLKLVWHDLNNRQTQLGTRIMCQSPNGDFNIKSADELGRVLYDDIGIRSAATTATGKRSVAADALERLAGKHKIVADVLEYRHLGKLKSTYAEALLRRSDDNHKED